MPSPGERRRRVKRDDEQMIRWAATKRCACCARASTTWIVFPNAPQKVGLRVGFQGSRYAQAFGSVREGSGMPEKQKSSRNAELSSVLDAYWVFASQCQQSWGSGGSRSRNAELSSFLDACSVSISKMSPITGIRRVEVAKRRIVVSFPRLSGLRISKKSITGIGVSWSQNAELSWVLDACSGCAS